MTGLWLSKITKLRIENTHRTSNLHNVQHVDLRNPTFHITNAEETLQRSLSRIADRQFGGRHGETADAFELHYFPDKNPQMEHRIFRINVAKLPIAITKTVAKRDAIRQFFFRLYTIWRRLRNVEIARDKWCAYALALLKNYALLFLKYRGLPVVNIGWRNGLGKWNAFLLVHAPWGDGFRIFGVFTEENYTISLRDSTRKWKNQKIE